MANKPHLLVLSHVLPFLQKSGQQQRVYYTLKAAREFFHVTFLAPVETKEIQKVREKILPLCDEVILLPSRYLCNKISKIWYKICGALYCLKTSLKFSNYLLGRLEFTPQVLASFLKEVSFDCVLFEYWHAANCVSIFHHKGIPCVLDMHNILWQSYLRQLNTKPWILGWWKRRVIAQYKKQEEQAWRQFDGIITINQEEHKYVQSRVPHNIRLFYAPMGIDLNLWPYSWQPAQPPRIAYYGGLGSSRNRLAALICYKHIMPAIWQEFPKAELWLIGSNPSPSLRALSADPRIKVTGYLENIQQVLRTMSVVVCPWSGTYGFRSRLVEVMALGIPVAANRDAIYGMGLEEDKGILISKNEQELVNQTLKLLRNQDFIREQSRLARKQVEEGFSFEVTYGQLAKDLLEFTLKTKPKG